MDYFVKYKLHFHTFNKIVVDNLLVYSGTDFFYEGMNRKVRNVKDAVDFVKAAHRTGNIKKLFKLPEEVFTSNNQETGATSLHILKCWNT